MNLAYKAFSMTGAYDAMISRYFADQVGDQFPDTLNLSLKKVEHLRYGENSQQAANKYEDSYVQKSLLDYEQLHGKEISFNNVNDLYGAVALVREFGDQIVTAAIMKLILNLSLVESLLLTIKSIKQQLNKCIRFS